MAVSLFIFAIVGKEARYYTQMVVARSPRIDNCTAILMVYCSGDIFPGVVLFCKISHGQNMAYGLLLRVPGIDIQGKKGFQESFLGHVYTDTNHHDSDYDTSCHPAFCFR